MSLKQEPRIGVGVFVIKDNKILLGKRVHSHGSGMWAPPGGHLEFGETPQECAERELQEETALIAEKIITVSSWTNDFFEKEQKHYVTLFIIVSEFQGTLTVQEPEKCLEWKWFAFDDLPTPLFPTVSSFISKDPLQSVLLEYLPESKTLI